jgi:hypothetical protein
MTKGATEQAKPAITPNPFAMHFPKPELESN